MVIYTQYLNILNYVGYSQKEMRMNMAPIVLLFVQIVFLMTVKPPLQASSIAMATAAGSGLLAALTCFARRTAHASVVSA
jgi:hypothetical protein